MEESLNKVNELVDASKNIPDKLKPIVKAICRGYIRVTNGAITASDVNNICETIFYPKDPNDLEYSGEERAFARTHTFHDENGRVKHGMSYMESDNAVWLISILTHEIGHVITEHNIEPAKNGKFSVVKKTADFYFNCYYDENENLFGSSLHGFQITDGFLESTCAKIFESKEFREELLRDGFDLKDYIYKDPRLFPSRVYDEYRACFELFDYILDGALTTFATKEFKSTQEIVDYVNKYRLINIYKILDSSNGALWDIKKYEGKEASEEFKTGLQKYFKCKENALALAQVLMMDLGKDLSDPKFIELYNTYVNTVFKQILPITQEDLEHTDTRGL